MIYKKIILFFSLYFVTMASYAKAPFIVTTIKPVHALVSAVMKDVGTPKLIIEGANSPHGFRLKPSHMRALNNADYVFYIHSDIEVFLRRLLEQDSQKFKALSTIEGLKIHPVRFGDHWQHCDHDHDSGHEDHDDIHRNDPHIWLSRYNAKKMVDYIAHTLSESDHEHSEIYKKNAKIYKQRIDDIDFSDLEALPKKNFIVFHDAYQYFEKEHDLRAMGAVSLDPQLPAKPRKLSQLRKHIQDMNVQCVFKEPQFSNKLIHTVTNKRKLHIGVLDPLGGSLEAGGDLYIQLIKDMKNSFKKCFETVTSE